MKVYFNEYNIPMGNKVYLPLASGMLKAYAEKHVYIKRHYELMPFIFKRDTVDNLVAKHDNPRVACFSVSIWNYNLSIEVAKRLKQKYPKCLIIFGGPSAPKKETYPINFVIHGQGEIQFVDILLPYDLTQSDFINCLPSPYTTGQFDYLLNDGTEYQAIIETNRGCHHGCYYCYWGSGKKKYEFFDLKRIKEEADWMGRNKIKYVFCADSNFGTFKRDVEISQTYADVKAKYGYPEKFRVCYGKTNTENIFKAAKILSKARLAKAITMSRQTNNNAAMVNVGRKNIPKTIFDDLQKKYEDAGIYTYSEFILGLPGETSKTFKEGISDILKTKTKLFIYHCTVLPNTKMANPEYQKKHGIKTVRVPISEIHCEIRKQGSVIEYEDIIIETNTMTKKDWIDCAAFSWIVQLKHSLKLPSMYLRKGIIQKFYKIAEGITEGKTRGQIDKRFGNIYWEPEEAAYLDVMYKTGDPVEFAKQEILYGRKGR